MVFSPRGDRIVSGSDDKTVRLWDARSGAELAILRGHERSVTSVDVSPRGDHIVSGSWDGTVRLWCARSGAELAVLRGHELQVMSVAFFSDGNRIVSGSHNNTVRVWDATSGAELTIMRVNEKSLECVGISPRRDRIATTSFFNNTVSVRDADNGLELTILRGHEAWVNSVAFSPNGDRIVSGSRGLGGDDTVRVWDAATGRCLKVIEGHGDVRAIAAGSQRFSFLLMARGLETVVLQAPTASPWHGSLLYSKRSAPTPPAAPGPVLRATTSTSSRWKVAKCESAPRIPPTASTSPSSDAYGMNRPLGDSRHSVTPRPGAAIRRARRGLSRAGATGRRPVHGRDFTCHGLSWTGPRRPA